MTVRDLNDSRLVGMAIYNVAVSNPTQISSLRFKKYTNRIMSPSSVKQYNIPIDIRMYTFNP